MHTSKVGLIKAEVDNGAAPLGEFRKTMELLSSVARSHLGGAAILKAMVNLFGLHTPRVILNAYVPEVS